MTRVRVEVNDTVKICGTDVVGVVTSFSGSTVNIEAEEGTEYIVPHGAVQIVERWTGVDGRCP